ncbi:MAG: metallophosphoesterase [Oligoflexia bacterium]|nr:metallophosphoesterase [Oligoflexia bacterium]
MIQVIQIFGILAALLASCCTSFTFAKINKQMLAALQENASAINADFRRNWQVHPALVNIDSFTGTLYVVGDVHGDFEHLLALLVHSGIVAVVSSDNGRSSWGSWDIKWMGGNAILVQSGDMINKGSESIKCLRFMAELELKARAAGGKVLVLAGNHEVGFLAEPARKKYRNFVEEIDRLGLDIFNDVYSPNSWIGDWLRTRPLAAVINGVYMGHTGLINTSSLEELTSKYQQAVDSNNWGDQFLIGRTKKENSILTSESWWKRNPPGAIFSSIPRIKGIIFGHDPNAFGIRGRIVGFSLNNGLYSIIKVDVGVWDGESNGAIYRCSQWMPGGGCALHEVMYNLQSPGGQSRFEQMTLFPTTADGHLPIYDSGDESDNEEEKTKLHKGW